MDDTKRLLQVTTTVDKIIEYENIIDQIQAKTWSGSLRSNWPANILGVACNEFGTGGKLNLMNGIVKFYRF